jgi:hypothetical protein
MNKNAKHCLFKSEFCTGIASSKEHVIHNSRRKFLRKKGANLENQQAQYRGITCAKCNEYLGRKEEKYHSSLAISTLWKVLAGNVNGLFKNHPWALTKNTEKDTLHMYLEILRDAFIGDKIFPENMLGYDLSYTATTNKEGKAELNVIIASEGAFVIKDILKIKNLDIGDSEQRKIDMLTYHTHTNNNFRMLFFLPLIPKNFGFSEGTKIRVSHHGFQLHASNYFGNENMKIVLKQIYPNKQN